MERRVASDGDVVLHAIATAILSSDSVGELSFSIPVLQQHLLQVHPLGPLDDGGAEPRVPVDQDPAQVEHHRLGRHPHASSITRILVETL